jgi:hypothetical protein
LKASIFGTDSDIVEPKVMVKTSDDDEGIFDNLEFPDMPDLPEMPEDDAKEPCVGFDCDYSLPEAESPEEPEPFFEFGESD